MKNNQEKRRIKYQTSTQKTDDSKAVGCSRYDLFTSRRFMFKVFVLSLFLIGNIAKGSRNSGEMILIYILVKRNIKSYINFSMIIEKIFNFFLTH